MVGSPFTVVLVGLSTRSRGSGHVFLCSVDLGSLPMVLGYTLMLSVFCAGGSACFWVCIGGHGVWGRKMQRVGKFNFFDSYDFWSGQWIDGFNLFIEMRRAGVDIVDLFILSSIVGASANLAALELGKQIHCLVLSLGYESSLFVSNALVDMYAKCSDILAAKTIFDTMCRRDIVSWTSIIVGMAQHG
ncbi:hypothetical protein ACSBR1_031493 [Camellia fascicularis]